MNELTLIRSKLLMPNSTNLLHRPQVCQTIKRGLECKAFCLGIALLDQPEVNSHACAPLLGVGLFLKDEGGCLERAGIANGEETTAEMRHRLDGDFPA